jgi:hypothetical protein
VCADGRKLKGEEKEKNHKTRTNHPPLLPGHKHQLTKLRWDNKICEGFYLKKCGLGTRDRGSLRAAKISEQVLVKLRNSRSGQIRCERIQNHLTYLVLLCVTLDEWERAKGREEQNSRRERNISRAGKRKVPKGKKQGKLTMLKTIKGELKLSWQVLAYTLDIT